MRLTQLSVNLIVEKNLAISANTQNVWLEYLCVQILLNFSREFSFAFIRHNFFDMLYQRMGFHHHQPIIYSLGTMASQSK